jgi:dienelactone hydrolase
MRKKEMKSLDRYRTPINDLKISRKALSHYGSIEKTIRQMREARPLDLNAGQWRMNNPGGTFEAWRKLVRECVLEGLHYNPGPLDMKPEVLDCMERPEFIMEKIEFNTTPWNRVKGYFLMPKGAELPVPGLLVFHEWGGPIMFGKERVVDSGRDHPILAEHRKTYTSGKYLAEEFARKGYAVVVIDAWHFGERVPRGLNGIPETLETFDMDLREEAYWHNKIQEQLYLGVRQLNWAGTTWMGVNFWDDSRCVDYLLSRKEVDPSRIGCTGLSGGGWRTDFLAALDPRVKAAVAVGWMTTGDYQQIYNVSDAIGTFCLLPGVWDRLDIPDLTIMSAPCASMVVSGSQDILFPPEGQQDAARQIQLGYEWAGCPEKFQHNNPAKPHCYDKDIQRDAVKWFEKHLKKS